MFQGPVIILVIVAAINAHQSPQDESRELRSNQQCNFQGDHIFPGDCQKYYHCHKGELEIKECFFLKKFDPNRRICRWFFFVNCHTHTLPTSPTPITETQSPASHPITPTELLSTTLSVSTETSTTHQSSTPSETSTGTTLSSSTELSAGPQTITTVQTSTELSSEPTATILSSSETQTDSPTTTIPSTAPTDQSN